MRARIDVEWSSKPLSLYIWRELLVGNTSSVASMVTGLISAQMDSKTRKAILWRDAVQTVRAVWQQEWMGDPSALWPLRFYLKHFPTAILFHTVALVLWTPPLPDTWCISCQPPLITEQLIIKGEPRQSLLSREIDHEIEAVLNHVDYVDNTRWYLVKWADSDISWTTERHWLESLHASRTMSFCNPWFYLHADIQGAFC